MKERPRAPHCRHPQRCPEEGLSWKGGETDKGSEDTERDPGHPPANPCRPTAPQPHAGAESRLWPESGLLACPLLWAAGEPKLDTKEEC